MILEDLKSSGVLSAVINYKNTDYAPVMIENKYLTFEENLKNIVVSCVFAVDSNLIKNISKVKKLLRNTTISYKGYEYDIILESVSELEIVDEPTVLIKYICKGNIYLPKKNKIISGSGVVEINSNGSTPIDIKITNATGRVVINDMIFNDLTRGQTVVIDSTKGKVIGIADDKWNFWEFPKVEDSFKYRISGNATIEVSWRERV